MNLIIDFLKRANLLELLTILFFINVGISLTYKIGFYNTIGADWYIQNLSPPQLFISSISISLASIIGVVIGCYFGIKLKYKTIEKILLFIVGAYIMARYSLGDYVSGFNIIKNFEITLLVLNAFCFMFAISTEREYRIFKNPNFIGPLRDKPNKAIRIYELGLKILFSISIVYTPYAIGCDNGKLVNLNFSNLSYVELNGDNSKWLLVDMNGDKVLLKKASSKQKIFKLVEYKEIKQISSPL